MFRFASPYFLLLLLLVPLLLVARRHRQITPELAFSSLVDVRRLSSGPTLWLGRLLPVLKIAALVLMILALARPQWGTREVRLQTEGINIILGVDVSGSMAALDFMQGNNFIDRLEAVKGVVSDFVSRRNGDRIGLVVFGTQAYTQIPLTRDYASIESILKRVKIGAAGKETAIGDAIGIALKRLEDIPSKSNIIILLTDGRSNAGELPPMAATEIAVKRGIKIYTIGVGTKGKVPFKVNHPVMGERYVYRRVAIDEATLKQIAAKTNGLYFRANNTETLKEIYAHIDQLEKSKVEVKSYDHYNEYYSHFLIPALSLMGIWILLSNTRFIRLP